MKRAAYIIAGMGLLVLMAQVPGIGEYGPIESGGAGAGCPFEETCQADGYSMCWGTDTTSFCSGEKTSTLYWWAYDGQEAMSLDSTGDLAVVSDLTVADDITLTGASSISTTANGDLTLAPHGVGIVSSTAAIVACDGACPAWTYCDGSAGEGCFEDELEVRGISNFVAQAYHRHSTAFYGTVNEFGDGSYLSFTGSYAFDGIPSLHGSRSRDQLLLQLGGLTGNALVVAGDGVPGEYAKDYDHPDQTHGTIFLQSNANPDVDNTQWGSLHHDGDSFVIDSGKGVVYVQDALKADAYQAGSGAAGITDSSSYWLCTANDCSTTCQVTIEDGLIVGCP